MYEIETTEEFDTWLDKIRDGKTQKTIIKRIRTMVLGTLGKTRSLNGGDKRSQQTDIIKARELAKEI